MSDWTATGRSSCSLTCGGMTFWRSALDAPTSALHRAGPDDALRATLAQFAPEFPGAGACPGGWPPGPRHVQAPMDRGGWRGPSDQAVVAVPRFDASTNAASSF